MRAMATSNPESRGSVTSIAAPLLAALFASGCSVLPDVADPVDSTLQQRADRIGQEVARIRDLEFAQPVPAATKDKDELREAMRLEVESQWEEERLGEAERALKAFGLLPAEYDLRLEVVDLLKDQVGGYYDPRRKEFFTIENDDDSKGVEQFVLAHELVHALEDQHFDLEATRKRLGDDDDRGAALSSLIEGSAMEIGIEHLLDRQGVPVSTTGPLLRTLIRILTSLDAAALGGLGGLGGDESDESLEDLEKAPAILGRPLLFPYLRGFAFVNRMRSEFGLDAIDAMYADPPDSTEQILHPERYFDRRDRPVAITLPAPPAGFEERYQQTMGMLGTQIVLANFLDPDPTDADAVGEEYADGWDGDRYALWVKDGHETLAWIVVFDYEHEAEDFEAVYAEILARRSARQGSHAVRRDGLVVAAVWNAPQGEGAALCEHLLAGGTISAAPHDLAPERWYHDVLYFPASLRIFERAWQWEILGGHAIHYRNHRGGHRFHVLDGLALESESNADRNAFWVGLGLVGFHHDRTLDATFFRIPLALNGHSRGSGEAHRSRYGLAIDALLYEDIRGARTFELAWGLVCTVKWGAHPAAEPGLRILFIPIPGT
jgi:hypothetical protein